MLPLLLAAALIFSTVMSVGFAKWQDTLTINADVKVKNKPLKISVSKNNPFTDYASLRTSTSSQNWVVYTVESYLLIRRSYMAYNIDAAWNESTNTFTIKNDKLVQQTVKNDNLISDKSGTIGSKYNYWCKDRLIGVVFEAMMQYKVGNTTYPVYALDEYHHSGAIGDYDYTNYQANIPCRVTLKNENGTAVTISGLSCSIDASIKNTNGTSITSLTIPANGEASFIVTPSSTTTAANNNGFTVTFVEDGKSRLINFKIVKSDPSLLGSGAPKQSRPPVTSSAPDPEAEQPDGTTAPTGTLPDPTSGSTTESTTESTTQPAAEPTTESTTEPTTEPSAETTSTEAPTTTTTTTTTKAPETTTTTTASVPPSEPESAE